MKRLERDVVALFNALWYRDFPLSEGHRQVGSRAEWTTHIGICIRSISDLMGYFTHFEGGIRTDAVIKDNRGECIANVEWEWKQPFQESVNEIEKLYSCRDDAQVSIFIGYSRDNMHEQNMDRIAKLWPCSKKTLVVFLITYEYQGGRRIFDTLDTYLFKGGKYRRNRSQPALPWHVPGTRWETIERD